MFLKTRFVCSRPADVKNKVKGVSKTTARFPIRSGPKQLAAYLNGKVFFVEPKNNDIYFKSLYPHFYKIDIHLHLDVYMCNIMCTHFLIILV